MELEIFAEPPGLSTW